MGSTDRAKALLEIVRLGLSNYEQLQKGIMLGDRHSYIGMSDIGRYCECPRAAVAAKLDIQGKKLGDMITLQRGHWFEHGVGQSLEALGLNILTQLELECAADCVPIKAHFDFVLVWEQPELAVRILEVKSVSQVPDMAFQSHELQIHGQAALLQKWWNEPVFSLRDKKGRITDNHLTFPAICQRHFGMDMPCEPTSLSLEGWLLYLSMQNAAAFGPYTPNEDLLRLICEYANNFWQKLMALKSGLLALSDLAYAKGFHPLCAWCHINSDCPKFCDSSQQNQWEPTIARLDSLKQSKATIDAEIREIEEALKLAYLQTGASGWLSTDAHRFKLASVRGRRTLDRQLLRQQLLDLFQGFGLESMDADSFIASCEKESSHGTRLYINPVN